MIFLISFSTFLHVVPAFQYKEYKNSGILFNAFSDALPIFSCGNSIGNL